MDYDQYLEECKKIKERNYLLLDLFKDDLIQSGLKDKTISRHLSNVEFYINEFLLYTDAYPMEEGLNMLDDYLGNLIPNEVTQSCKRQNKVHRFPPSGGGK